MTVPLSHLSLGTLVEPADWNDKVDAINLSFTEIGTTTGIVQRAQGFRGLHLRTHPDADLALNKVSLLGLDEIVLSDGARYASLSTILPLSADITASGAGGLDTGARAASTWCELYLIGKSSTKAIADLRLMLHRAKDYLKDTSFETAFDANRQLRLSTSTPTDKLAQGFQLATAGPLPFIDIPVQRVGAVAAATQVWVTIESDSGGNPSGVALATSVKIDASIISSTTFAYLRFPFYTPATLSASTQYHIVLQGNYTRSDTVGIFWSGVVAGGYASGSAKQNNGSAWSAAIGIGDFQFKAFVARNDTALSLPAGYDESCRLGFVYNSSGNALVPFRQIGRRVSTFAGSFASGVSNASPILFDLSALLPPTPVIAEVVVNATVGGDRWIAGGVPEGFGLTGAGIWPSSQGVPAPDPGGVSQIVLPTVHTEFQGVYAERGAGTGTASLFIRGWEGI